MTIESKKFMFLTPKDLRVGNYVNYENTTHVIDEIHTERVIHHWINYGGDGYVTHYTQILMIPISIKEIENLGFILDDDRVKNNPDLYFDDRGYCIEVDGDSFWLCKHNDENDVQRIVSIDYVHDLQNLYYDLTKRELKF